jgi:hypothetical protein
MPDTSAALHALAKYRLRHVLASGSFSSISLATVIVARATKGSRHYNHRRTRDW